MKTGTIVLAQHSSIQAECDFAEACAEFLRSRGRRNVRVAYHSGHPSSESVITGMFETEGIDTFCILPLAVAEGNQTIWNMPHAMGLPDNAGSWRMVGEHDVATRFSTAMGREPSIAEGIARMLGPVSDDTGIIIVAYGSELSQSAKTAEYYAQELRNRGWKTACGYARHGPSVGEAADELRGAGCTVLKAVPLSITVAGRSMKAALDSIAGCAEVLPPVSSLPEFMELLDSKVPEDW